VGNFSVQETPKSVLAQEHCSRYTDPMFHRELLTHPECCGAARRIWLWNRLTVEPFKILSHDFTLPLYVYDDLLNSVRKDTSSAQKTAELTSCFCSATCWA